MRATDLHVLFICSILLLGCIQTGGERYNYGTYNVTNVTGDGTIRPNVTGTFEFSVPSELPIAYVGKEFEYSFNPVGGELPYEFSYDFYQVAYDNSSRPAYLKNLGYWIRGEPLNFTPEEGEEGQYVLEVCAYDRSMRSYDAICKNTTLYIMSDTVDVKGMGGVSSFLIWDPRGDVAAVRGATRSEDSNQRPNIFTLVPASEISNVSLSATVPAKSGWGGGNAQMTMVANSTSVSISASGSGECGTEEYGFSKTFRSGGFLVSERETRVGLNITNNGIAEKVVDITVTARIANSPDSKYYEYVGTAIYIDLGEAFCRNETCIDIDNTYWPYISHLNTEQSGKEIAKSIVIRAIVEPGSHFVEDRISGFGGIKLAMNGCTKGCPCYAGTSGEVTLTVKDADLSDGKKPTMRID